MNNGKEYDLIFFAHIILISASIASPFLCSWQFLLFWIGVYYALLFIFGNCILTRWQFKNADKNISFTGYYLAKAGIHPSPRTLRIFFHYLLPWSLFAIALVWQVGLHNSVPLRVDFWP